MGVPGSPQSVAGEETMHFNDYSKHGVLGNISIQFMQWIKCNKIIYCVIQAYIQHSMPVYTLGTLSGDSDYMHSGGYCMSSYDFQLSDAVINEYHNYIIVRTYLPVSHNTPVHPTTQVQVSTPVQVPPF